MHLLESSDSEDGIVTEMSTTLTNVTDAPLTLPKGKKFIIYYNSGRYVIIILKWYLYCDLLIWIICCLSQLYIVSGMIGWLESVVEAVVLEQGQIIELSLLKKQTVVLVVDSHPKLLSVILSHVQVWLDFFAFFVSDSEF